MLLGVRDRMRDTLSNLTPSPLRKVINEDALDENMDASSQSDIRGLKRKAQSAGYDDVRPYDAVHDGIRRTPLRNVKARKLPNATDPATRSARNIKRRSYTVRNPTHPRQIEESSVSAPVNLEDTQVPDTSRPQPDSTTGPAPIADMGGATGLRHTSTEEISAGANANPRKQTSGPKNDVTEVTGANQEDDGEEHEVVALLDHRMVEIGSVDLLVHWAGKSAEQATWEPEREIQLGAADLLYDYWQNGGGRTEVLFHAPKDPPPAVYHVFKVLHHEKVPCKGFNFQVQWVGYPASPADITVEPEPKLKKIAPTALTEYWDSLGGRNKFLKKKRSAKKL